MVGGTVWCVADESAVSAVMDRRRRDEIQHVDSMDSRVRLAFKNPISIANAEPSANADELNVAHLVPIQIRRCGVDMRPVIDGSGAHAAPADPALFKAGARGRVNGRRI